jgi:hypothetical protein
LLSDAIGRDQLRIGIEGNKRPLITQASAIVAGLDAGLLLADKTPNLALCVPKSRF